MWKKKICAVLIVSLLIGEIYFVQKKTTLLIQAENESGLKTEFLKDKTEIANSKNKKAGIATPDNPEKNVTSSKHEKENATTSNTVKKKSDNSKNKKEDMATPSDAKKIMCLQIPEKLNIVLDPWEIDENGQIYSEPFTVKNTGDNPGVLVLSFTCKVDDKITFRKTLEGLHNSSKKLIYMTMTIGDSEKIVFTREVFPCQVKLLPGEELSLRFEGEINENAKELWKKGDIEIQGMYTWEEESSFETEKEINEENRLPKNKPKEE